MNRMSRDVQGGLFRDKSNLYKENCIFTVCYQRSRKKMKTLRLTKLGAKMKEAGFTLVELAVVMIIIGLLIGGVLKGQELITNAQISSTVTQIRGIDTAAVTFRDMYNSLPGTVRNPGSRLPNCTSVPCLTNQTGTGSATTSNPNNGRLDMGFDSIPDDGGEAAAFFVHMAKADLMGGIDEGIGPVFGGYFPQANVSGSGFHAAFVRSDSADDMMPGLSVAGDGVDIVRSGHYLSLHSSVQAGAAVTGDADSAILTPNMAARIDRKLDDGSATTGTIYSMGEGTDCAAENGTYAEATTDLVCGLYIRIQQ